MEVKKHTCFIIMPFATTNTHDENYWNEHYENFLEPIITEIGNIKVSRSSPMRSDILKGIIKDLIHANIVVADLTDSNPNVFWELGVRQSFKHGTVTIAEEGTKLPFDISSKGTLFYHNKNHLKTKEFTSKLKNAVLDCIKNPKRPDSNVLETLTGRGTIQEITLRDEIRRKLDALIVEYESNYKSFNLIVNEIRQNRRANMPGKGIRTERLRKTCLELLITHRYFDTTNDLYNYSEEYCDLLNVINGQLAVWESHPENTEKWFLTQVKTWRKEFLTYKRKIFNEIQKFYRRN
jgi:hypothetical protein